MLNREELAFIAVAQEGGFTSAAEKLKTSKARVSQLVTRLEGILGVTLLHRSTRSIRLTDEGSLYFSECMRANDILSNARKQLAEDRDRISGLIRLNSVGGLFAEELLGPAINDFISDYPDVNIHLDFTSVRVDVMAEQYDLVVRMGKLEDSSLVARQLTLLGTKVVATPRFIEQHGLPAEPWDLVKFPCICGSIKRWKFLHEQSGEVQEVNVVGPLSSPNGHLLRRAALDHLGIVRLHDLYLRDDLIQQEVFSVFKDWVIESQPVSLIYPKARYRTRRIKLFVEHLVNWFERI